MPDHSKEHTALCRQALAAIGALPGVMPGLNPCGIAVQFSRTTGKQYSVSYGWPCAGGPDILVTVEGRLLGLEAKTGASGLSPDQRRVHKALEAAGVPCIVFRSVGEAVAAVEGMRAFCSRGT